MVPRRWVFRLGFLLALLGLTSARAGDETQRQMTMFAIVATPDGETTDPRVISIVDALKRLRPGYGFELKVHKSERVGPGERIVCDLGDGLSAEAKLVQGQDPSNGKLRIAFTITRDGKAESTITVVTPPNQLFICEKPLKGDTKLLIAVTAR